MEQVEAGDGAQLRTYPPEHFEFTGTGGEYFRIWIVNLVLSILTLGIYSAWAKVRRLKYFYQHTNVAGGSFDYHGDPVAILKGRILAFLLFLVYTLATEVPGWPLLVALVLIGLLLPLLMRSAFRFRLHYSSYRGLRFSFRGTNKQSYITFLGFGALTIMTAYLAAPLFHHRLKRFQHGESWFGNTPFKFTATEGGFFGVYIMVSLIMLGALIGTVFAFGGMFAALGSGLDPGENAAALIPILFGFFVIFLALSFVLAPLFQSRIGNLIWNHTQLGESRFESRLRFWPLFFIMTTNFILILLSFGLFTPWASVRLARYRAECLSILPSEPVDSFIAARGDEITASGEEMTEMFDFDVGL